MKKKNTDTWRTRGTAALCTLATSAAVGLGATPAPARDGAPERPAEAAASAGITTAGPAPSGPRELGDAALDAVTAGSAHEGERDDVLRFDMVRQTQGGRTVTAEGDLRFADSLAGIHLGSLNLTDDAQSELRSLVNINAVNSSVNVLLNLNVTIDSTVGTIDQLNVNSPLPAPPRPRGP